MDHSTVTLEDLRYELAGSRRAAWVRALIVPGDDQKARLAAMRTTVGPKPAGWEDKEWVYTQCAFISGQITGRRLGTWLKGGERKVALGPLSTMVAFPDAGGFTRTHVPSLVVNNGGSFSWPSFQTKIGFTDGGHFNAPQGYFVGVGDTPSFPTFGSAFNSFFYGRQEVTGVSNSIEQQLTLEVIDRRARVERVRIRPASIDVWLGGTDLAGTVLELGGVEYRKAVPVTKKHVRLPLPNGVPSDPWLWLKQDGDWLDLRPLTHWGGKLSPDIEFDFPRDVGAELSELASRGEGPLLEYKQKLPETAREKRNVFKTVAAFANGSGGTILFGIEDESLDPIGLEGSRNEERRRLNDMLRDLVSPPPHATIEDGDFNGKFLLVLQVHGRPGTIHALTIDRSKPEYYVRRDGSTYLAKPEELEAIAGR